MTVQQPVGRTLAARYDALVALGTIVEDGAQRETVRRLDALNERLAEVGLASKHSALGWLFGRRKNGPEPVRGLYIWGGVGRGKTMLMDLFMDVAAPSLKRRVHFHEFMADVHQRIFEWRQAHKRGEVKGDDPIAPVASSLASEAHLLCFDEFVVSDITDAMILGRLFTQLFALGVVVVATSNVDPDELYKDGLNRQLFLPFLALLKENVDVLHLDAMTDYRLEKLGGARVYLTPFGPETDREFDELWRKLTYGVTPHREELEMKGRRIQVPMVASGIARFSFRDLCSIPLGAADYLRIAGAYGTVFIEHVPSLDFARHNEAKRLINLIDAFYDKGIKLIISAEAEPDKLYSAERGTELFEFERTASRLIEMGSEAYLSGSGTGGEFSGK